MIAVIGGGAAGMAAAIEAARQGAQVTLWERGERLGRKLAATGNGRCNLTNLEAGPAHYFTREPAALAAVLKSSSPEDVIGFFLSLGLFVTEEEAGRVYPSCFLANAVVDVLRAGLAEAGVAVRTGCALRGIEKAGEGFLLVMESGERAFARKVIVACGGPAAPDLGGSGFGAELMAGLGHEVLPAAPSLTPLCCEEKVFRSLKGIRVRAGLTARLTATEDVLRRERGELQLTEYGVSGIPALNASTQAALALASGLGVKLCVDLLPDMPGGAVEAMLFERRKAFLARRCEGFLLGVFHRRIGELVQKRAGLLPERQVGSLTDDELWALAQVCKDLRFRCVGVQPFGRAQCATGGASLAQFSPKTLESLVCPGIYAAGEVLDVAGDCGGFNLHFAWVSGRLAGRAAAAGV